MITSPQRRQKSHARRQAPKRGRKPIIEVRPKVWDEAIKKLIHDHSPEQISNTFKAELAVEPLKWISYETICTYIYALPKAELRKLLTSHLRLRRKLRKDRLQHMCKEVKSLTLRLSLRNLMRWKLIWFQVTGKVTSLLVKIIKVLLVCLLKERLVL